MAIKRKHQQKTEAKENVMTSITISQSRQSWIAMMTKTILTTLKTWQENIRMRRELALIDPRDLGDVGISTGLVDYELRKPFWKSPGHLR